jgi:hypothetical protein
VTTGAAIASTDETPRLDLLEYFPDDDDADFRRAVGRIMGELERRVPMLAETFALFVSRIATKPTKFLELHGADGLTDADRRRLEPRLPERLQAYVLVVGALLVWMDLPSLRCGKLVHGERVFGLGQKYIHDMTGLSLGRIRRAIADLVAAKYLTWKQPVAQYVKAGAPGAVGYCAWNAIYRFEVRFFERLHRDKKLAKQRQRARERRANRVRIYAASLLRARDALRRAREHLGRHLEIVPAPAPRWRPPPKR